MNLYPINCGFSRNPCKSLTSNGSLNVLHRSPVALGHIWTQNLREHVAKYGCCSAIVLTDHVSVAVLVLHPQRHPRIIMTQAALPSFNRNIPGIHLSRIEMPETIQPFRCDTQFSKQWIQPFFDDLRFTPRSTRPGHEQQPFISSLQ